MQIIKPLALGLCTRPLSFRGHHRLSISAYVYFPFDQASPALWTEASMWAFLGGEMPGGPLIDEGIAKTTAEFLVHGYAYPPGGSGTACAVRAQVGRCSKTLLAFGPRYWQHDGRAAAPLAFTRLPLDWAHAYGGPEVAANPVGMGHAREIVSGVPVQRLPALEYPQARLLRADQQVPPAGFGRIDPSWPPRARHRGTYDDRWLKTRSPGFADDLDWRYFNLAPDDQWLDTPYVGDEPFVFEHMHPHKTQVSGQLPGVRVRAFLARGDAAPLRETTMRLTTTWFFPHAECGVLVFHGLAESTEDDASDVTLLVGAIERLEAARPAAHYQTVVHKRQDPEMGQIHALTEDDLVPEGMAATDPAFEAAMADYQVGQVMKAARQRNVTYRLDAVREEVRAQGLDPDALGIRMPPLDEPPPLKDLAPYLQRQMRRARLVQRRSLRQARRRQRELAASPQVQEAAAAAHRGPPEMRAMAQYAVLKQQMPPEQAAALLPQLVQAEAATRLAYLRTAHTQLPAPRRPSSQSQALRTRLTRGADASGQDLTGADLSRLDLRGCNFTGAQMESVSLVGANVSGAVFMAAVLAHADLRGMIAIGTTFRGANLGGAQWAGAVLDGADLSEATLMSSDLTGSSLRGAQLAGALLLETRWGAADWSGVRARDQTFYQARLGALDLRDADLSGSSFIQCDLRGATLAGATLTGASFLTCNLEQVSLAGATLSDAVFSMHCLLGNTDFTGAQMRGCNLRGQVLSDARFDGAVLDGADVSEAVLIDASLREASLKGALMIRTVLVQASLAGANLMDAIVQKADLRGADLRGACLLGADLSNVITTATTDFSGAFTVRARTWPRQPVQAPLGQEWPAP